jgi:hypothetical protein
MDVLIACAKVPGIGNLITGHTFRLSERFLQWIAGILFSEIATAVIAQTSSIRAKSPFR